MLLDKWISSYVFVFFSGRNIVREADNGGIDHEKIRKDFQSHLFPEVEILEEEGFTIDPIWVWFQALLMWYVSILN